MIRVNVMYACGLFQDSGNATGNDLNSEPKIEDDDEFAGGLC